MNESIHAVVVWKAFWAHATGFRLANRNGSRPRGAGCAADGQSRRRPSDAEPHDTVGAGCALTRRGGRAVRSNGEDEVGPHGRPASGELFSAPSYDPHDGDKAGVHGNSSTRTRVRAGRWRHMRSVRPVPRPAVLGFTSIGGGQEQAAMWVAALSTHRRSRPAGPPPLQP